MPCHLDESEVMAKASRTESDPRFDDTLARLHEIVGKLESGELPLEDSLALFEEGVGLSRRAQSILEGAQKRIDELLGVDANGQPKTAPFPSER
jgi:exodeoxyribonuclease VII small subunit